MDLFGDGADFLDEDLGDANLAAEVQRERRALADWGARTLATRRPELPPHRGIKGVRTLEADLDVMLRQLGAALAAGDPEPMQRHARWYEQVVQGRPHGPEALAAGVEILAEGLLRFLGAERGNRAARWLLDAHAAAAPPDVRPFLG